MSRTPHVLLLGGHGKVSLLLTPKILARAWNLTSVIRNPAQEPALVEAGKNGPGKINALVESLEDVKSVSDAGRILDTVKPDWVVWSAGAGGHGGPDRTYAIDRDACIHFIRASVSRPSITKFLLVSALSIRRNRAPWWDEDSYATVQKVNNEMMPHYYKAKLAADEALTILGEERIRSQPEGPTSPNFGYIILRPGNLSDKEETDKISLGKTKARGAVSRGDVAEVAVRLLEKEGIKGWFDLLEGDEGVASAVERVVKEGVDSIEGESLDAMREDLEKQI
ncbi:Uncharacterized protein BP5553_03694 [Venustampulla echinocandica]|uniref:NAD(P)-binding domain-containing protein n=1 Tax=Venustampulla echinocandica TaxID=2656787 RepID=A0A370TUZ8_9HELO|nr:Uncharacterized protein BP5553_03694 [Venustampulla echinocandica]RDL39354.1 Uncharacterized protein BP5553_03694 [Venustampulla echinocandica]